MAEIRLAASRISSPAVLRLKRAQGRVAPVSFAMMSASSPLFCWIKSAALRKTSRRNAGVVRFHVLKAAAAASTAAAASETVAAPHRWETLPVTGETTSNERSGW
ncbi:hypothetical protein TgHK011_008561 [Trichoderma gracile]|nr:hypothetical protein TgHK011_008561 [Trichoderma gracile]